MQINVQIDVRIFSPHECQIIRFMQIMYVYAICLNLQRFGAQGAYIKLTIIVQINLQVYVPADVPACGAGGCSCNAIKHDLMHIEHCDSMSKVVGASAVYGILH